MSKEKDSFEVAKSKMELLGQKEYVKKWVAEYLGRIASDESVAPILKLEKVMNESSMFVGAMLAMVTDSYEEYEQTVEELWGKAYEKFDKPTTTSLDNEELTPQKKEIAN